MKNGSHLVIRQENEMIKNIFKENSLTTSLKKVSLEDIEDLLLKREVERANEESFYNSILNENFESEREEDFDNEDDFWPDDLDSDDNFFL